MFQDTCIEVRSNIPIMPSTRRRSISGNPGIISSTQVESFRVGDKDSEREDDLLDYLLLWHRDWPRQQRWLLGSAEDARRLADVALQASNMGRDFRYSYD